MASIQGIYIALFGRPADPAGLAYFDQVTNHGANLSAISNLSGSEEYQARFKGMSPNEIVTAIYKSLLGREPEAGGLSYWVEKLAGGSFSVNTIAIAVLDSAMASDKATVEAKIAIADAFTKSLDTPQKIAAYVGPDAVKQIQTYLAGVTWDHPGSVSDLGSIVANLGTPAAGGGDSGLVGLNIALTTAEDHVVAAATNDVISGRISSDPATNTYDANDTIDGGAGSDTLKLTIDPNISGSAFTTIYGENLTGIEKISLTQLSVAGRTYDLTSVSGLTDVINDGSVDDSQGFHLHLADQARLTIKNTASGIGLVVDNLDGADDHLSIVLDHAGTVSQTSGVMSDMGQVGEYEALAIESTGSTTNYLELFSIPVSQGATLTVTGAAALNLTTWLDNPLSIDASKATGAITLGNSDRPIFLNEDTQAKLGSGNDTAYIAFEGDVTIDGGAGTDRLVIKDWTPLTHVTNFEILRIERDGNSSGHNIQSAAGFHEIEIGEAGSGNVELNDVANDANFTMASTNYGGLRLNLADDSGSNDQLTLNLTGDTGSNLGAIYTSDGLEILNFSVTGTGTGIYSSDSLAKHVITGTGDLQLWYLNNAASVDASAMTGSLTLGLGSNVIDHTVKSGSGNDTIMAGYGSDNIDTGAGDDIVDVQDRLDSGDVIDGGAGTDRLIVSNGAGSLDFSHVSNFEILQILSNSQNVETDAGGFNTIEIAGATSGSGGDVHLTGLLNNSSIELSDTFDTITLELANNGAGASDALTLRLHNIDSRTQMNDVAGLEVLNIDVEDGTSSGIAVGVTSKVVITGTGDLSLGAAAATIDASGMSGHFSLATDNTDHNIVLGSGAGEVGLGAGSDTIALGKAGSNAQSGADIIHTGDGSDTVIFVGSSNTVIETSQSYEGIATIADFSLASDKLGFSANNADFQTKSQLHPDAAAVTGLSKGTVAQGLASGSFVMKEVPALGNSISAGSDASYLKLTHEVSLGGNMSNVLDAMSEAINGSAVEGLARGGNYLISYYDTNYDSDGGAAIFAVVNTLDDGALTASDFSEAGVSVIGAVHMSSLDYAAFNASNLVAV